MSAVINAKLLSQVKESLFSYIEQNKLGHQARLPSETAIAKTLGVSRNTLREAYIELENEGVIIRRHGIGTFVVHAPVIRDSLNEFSPFIQIIREGGFTPAFQTLSNDFETAPKDVREVFKMPTTSKIRCIRRIVRANKLPVIFVKDHINPAIEKTNWNWDAFDGNMIQFLSDSLPISLHRIQSLIRASILEPEFVKYLELPKGTPILSVRSTIFSEENKPVAYSNIYFNSNIIELNVVRMIHKQNLQNKRKEH